MLFWWNSKFKINVKEFLVLINLENSEYKNIIPDFVKSLNEFTEKNLLKKFKIHQKLRSIGITNRYFQAEQKAEKPVEKNKEKELIKDETDIIEKVFTLFFFEFFYREKYLNMKYFFIIIMHFIIWLYINCLKGFKARISSRCGNLYIQLFLYIKMIYNIKLLYNKIYIIILWIYSKITEIFIDYFLHGQI